MSAAPDLAATVYRLLGGRKQANGYLYALLITGAALPLDASFEAYAGFLAGALLGTSVIVASEDVAKHRNGRSSDASS